MASSREEKPDTWVDAPFEWKHVGSDVYMAVGPGTEVGGTGRNVYCCHWHEPTNGDEHRWQMSSCGLHTVHSVEPLHLEPSLACDNGCPSHGWVRDGVWMPA